MVLKEFDVKQRAQNRGLPKGVMQQRTQPPQDGTDGSGASSGRVRFNLRASGTSAKP